MTAERYLLIPIALGDIDDVEAFARSTIGRNLPSGMYLRPDEHEDEISEVVAQLVDWYRPVGPLRCVVCGRRRGEQHLWNCDALPPQRVRRSECLDCGVDRGTDELPATHADGCASGDNKGGWGCHRCGRKRGDRHDQSCEHRHERQQRYDPARTSSFILFARFRLNTYYIPDLCRRLLGRNGGRIAERSHSELDERAESGRRPWEAAAPEQDGVRADLAADAGGGTAGRDRARARGAALLGLRPPR